MQRLCHHTRIIWPKLFHLPLSTIVIRWYRRLRYGYRALMPLVVVRIPWHRIAVATRIARWHGRVTSRIHIMTPWIDIVTTRIDTVTARIVCWP